ncbi:MAG: glycosyltransferase [bacterium]
MNNNNDNSKKTIKYIGYYDKLDDGNIKRVFSLAATKKMDYICDVLNKLGYQVDIISCAHIKGKEEPFENCQKKQINPNVTLTLPPSMGATNKLYRILRVIMAKVWLFFHLLRNCSKGEKVLVYHHYEHAIPILLAHLIKRFEIVLEIEEKYSMVWSLTAYQRWKENLILNKGREKSLVVSELLAEKLNISNPIVSYGNYKPYDGEITNKGQNERTILIYTGSIDRVKGSAFIAISAMKYLHSEYDLLLSGPITDKDRVSFENEISELNKKSGRNACRYLGILDEKEYEKLLLSADIALNPQREGDFDEYLFPSKILTYMAYDLPVVSTKGKSIVTSSVSDLIYFAEDYSAESVAKAIKQVNFSNVKSSRKRMKNLGKEFQKQLYKTFLKSNEIKTK